MRVSVLLPVALEAELLRERDAQRQFRDAARRVGLRATEEVLRTVFEWLGLTAPIPDWTTVRTWLQRLGVAGYALDGFEIVCAVARIFCGELIAPLGHQHRRQ